MRNNPDKFRQEHKRKLAQKNVEQRLPQAQKNAEQGRHQEVVESENEVDMLLEEIGVYDNDEPP